MVSTNGDASGQSSQRVGDADRQAAVTALGEHRRAGRLDPTEHERRTTAAYQAATRGDIGALFADLPGGLPDPAASGASQDLRPAAPAPAQRPAQPDQPERSGRDPENPDGGLLLAGSWVGNHRNAIMGVTPFPGAGYRCWS